MALTRVIEPRGSYMSLCLAIASHFFVRRLIKKEDFEKVRFLILGAFEDFNVALLSNFLGFLV